MLLARATSNSLRPSIIGSASRQRRRFLLLTLSLLPSAANSLSSSSFFPNSRQMSTFVTERTGDGTITVSPKNEGDQSALVVISHGLGDTAEGFADVAEVSSVLVFGFFNAGCVSRRLITASNGFLAFVLQRKKSLLAPVYVFILTPQTSSIIISFCILEL
jgi:hypothetical protein